MANEKVTTFKDLKVWQKSHELVLAIYQQTKSFPPDEKFGLISQLRRSSASVPTNIAEGCKRKGKREFPYFLTLADSSLEETKYHLILSRDLHYLSEDDFARLTSKCDEVGRMLSGLQKSLSA